MNANKINSFLSKLNIYRKKFGEKYKNNWVSHNYYLTSEKFKQHYTGRCVLGVYATKFTSCFVLDIDDHDPRLPKRKYEYLNRINIALGTPNFVSTSPRGLHLYYFLTQKYNTKLLHNAIKHKIELEFNGFMPHNIEIYPTSDHFLKLPFSTKENNKICELHRGRLKIIFDSPSQINDFMDYVINQQEQNLEELIGCALHPQITEYKTIYNNTSQSTLQPLKSYRRRKSYSELEKIFIETYGNALQQGMSNTVILDMTYQCWISQWDLYEAQSFIADMINQHGSPMPDTRGRKLEKRIEARWKQCIKKYSKNKNIKNTINITNNTAIPMDTIKRIDELVSECPKNIQFKNNLKNFLINLVNWNTYIKNLDKDKKLLLNEIYTHFIKFVDKKGLIPLPKSLLVQWNTKYIKYITYLTEIGILSQKSGYSVGSYCRHFLFTLEKVIKRIRERIKSSFVRYDCPEKGYSVIGDLNTINTKGFICVPILKYNDS